MENFLPKGKIISEDKAVYVDKIIVSHLSHCCDISESAIVLPGT